VAKTVEGDRKMMHESINKKGFTIFSIPAFTCFLLIYIDSSMIYAI